MKTNDNNLSIKDDYGNYDFYEDDGITFKTPPAFAEKEFSESPGLGSSFLRSPAKPNDKLNQKKHIIGNILANEKFSSIPVFQALSVRDPKVTKLYQTKDPEQRYELYESIASTASQRLKILHDIAKEIKCANLPVGSDSYIASRYNEIFSGPAIETTSTFPFISFNLFYFLFVSFNLF